MGEYKPIGREVLIQGYLRKAPSSKQKSKYQDLTLLCGSCRVLLEARWKKRFCIFYKIRRSTETQIYFEYYKKQTDKRPKGCIDLNSCDCIYEQKTCNRWPNVFVVKTTHQRAELDYLFSANSLEEMNDWISQLTTVLHMVPDNIPAPPMADMLRRNSSSHYTPRRLMAPTVIPASSAKISNFLMNSNHLNEPHNYLDRDLTEEYRTSFGEAAADDEDCYHTLPQSDHAYVNLKDDGDATSGPAFKNDPEVAPSNNFRPDSIYFNVWDSSTVDVNIHDSAGGHVAFHNNLSELEHSKETYWCNTEDKTQKSHFQHCTDAHTSGTELPKRSRIRSTSSSSTLSSEDVNSGAEGSKDPQKQICRDNNSEAEAAIASSDDSVVPVLGETAVIKSKDTPEVTSTTNELEIHYLDAENLDFSLHQRGGRGGVTTIPSVPPKPAHLRRAVGTTIAPAEINPMSGDIGSNGYNELDPRSTQAFFMVTRKVFGDSDAA